MTVVLQTDNVFGGKRELHVGVRMGVAIADESDEFCLECGASTEDSEVVNVKYNYAVARVGIDRGVVRCTFDIHARM